ncbi:MAG: FMN-binding negative transcriptional regulator [Propionibacteriaceae bacterium]|nr:FMN-binding negative transcriptional regulator [Propionibacteriaceae bacterium]
MPDSDVREFLARVGTGTLVTVDPVSSRPLATFLPWVWTEGGRLITHIGLVNPQSGHGRPATPLDGSDPGAAAYPGTALLIVMGEDAFVSSRWLTQPGGATWDYETVHVYGDLVHHTDTAWIQNCFDTMMRHYDSSSIKGYDPEWLEKQSRAVVGLELIVTDVWAKSKLSQNRSEQEVRAIAQHLQTSCPHLAERVRQVSLPHVEARDARVRAATAYTYVRKTTTRPPSPHP